MQPEKQRRIGIMVTSLMGAGTEKTILTLAEALVREGALVDLYVLRDHRDYTPQAGVNCIWLKTSSNREARVRLKQRIAEKGKDYYDLFVISNAKYYPVVPVANKVCSVHITPTAWITDGPRWKFWSRARKIRNLSKKFAARPVIALSGGIRNDLVNNLKVPPENVRQIVNPFDLEAIRAAAAVEGDLPDGRYIVSIASLNIRKRHADTIRALGRMHNKEVSLVLVGRGKDENNLRALAKDLGLQERVIFWGWDENPYRLLKNAALSVLASEAEGSPRALIESLLVGTPAVATDCPSGPSEILVDELAPFLVSVGDVRALARAMDQALRDYPEIPAWIEERFDSAEVARRYLALLEDNGVADR